MEIKFDEFLEKAVPVAKMVEKEKGKFYLVGGCVRDWKMGIDEPKDYDFLVTGLTKEKFIELFSEAKFVGDEEDGFPVFLLTIGGEKCEIAFARKEKKIGFGYKGFETYTSPELTIYDDLERRDLTINAMAVDVITKEFIDPHNGLKDLKCGIIKHVSSAFEEDPLRVLRAARFAARYSFEIDIQTKKYMQNLKDEMNTFKPERVFEETKKALSGKKPSLYFKALKEIGVLNVYYEELYNLVGVEQNEKYHPEGDAFIHTMNVVDAMSELTESLEERFAALVHDLGKADSPARWEKNPTKNPVGSHYGHEEEGVKHVVSLCERLKVSKKWMKAGMFGAEFHGKMHKLHEYKKARSIGGIVQMIEKANRNPLGIEGMARIALSDTRGKGDFTAEHPNTEFWLKVSEKVLEVKGNPNLPVEDIAEDKIRRQIEVFTNIKKASF